MLTFYTQNAQIDAKLPTLLSKTQMEKALICVKIIRPIRHVYTKCFSKIFRK